MVCNSTPWPPLPLSSRKAQGGIPLCIISMCCCEEAAGGFEGRRRTQDGSKCRVGSQTKRKSSQSFDARLGLFFFYRDLRRGAFQALPFINPRFPSFLEGASLWARRSPPKPPRPPALSRSGPSTAATIARFQLIVYRRCVSSGAGRTSRRNRPQ